MIDQLRFFWQLLVLTSILLIAGILGLPYLGVEFEISNFIATTLSFTVINLITWLVMVHGIKHNNRDGMVRMLAGIGLKFLLYLLFILVYWLLTKNLTKPFILSFFALYLVFTFFLTGSVLKLLKNK
ncbi:MAG: hypothetical protein V2B15_19040 [Bacteroidota bacterium]